MIAIAKHEGFYEEGTLAQRQNNPGNIRRNGKFMNNVTVEEGWEDLRLVIKGYAEAGATIQTMMLYYAPASDGNNPWAYAQALENDILISKHTKLSELFE